MLNDLKQEVLDSGINRNILTPEQFELKVENRALVTRASIINDFF